MFVLLILLYSISLLHNIEHNNRENVEMKYIYLIRIYIKNGRIKVNNIFKNVLTYFAGVKLCGTKTVNKAGSLNSVNLWCKFSL